MTTIEEKKQEELQLRMEAGELVSIITDFNRRFKGRLGAERHANLEFQALSSMISEYWTRRREFFI